MYKHEMHGKVAIVTGAANGIGREIVKALASNGVVVAAVDCNREQLDILVDMFHEKEYKIFAYAKNVSNSSEIENLIEDVEENIGPIDFLINVAGILRLGSVVSCTDEDWETIFSVNTTGVFNLCRSVSKKMILRNSGSIVTVASNAGSVPRVDMAAYASSKAATIMFMKCLALELAKYNIRCNIVSPGSTDTEMQRKFWEHGNGENAVIQGELDKYRTGIPLRKIAAPSDISNAVLFLLSEQAGHITMNNLCIDGGASLGVQ